jgi:hypothetical protein
MLRKKIISEHVAFLKREFVLEKNSGRKIEV